MPLQIIYHFVFLSYFSRQNITIQESKFFFVLVISVDLGFGQEMLLRWYSDKMICSQNNELLVNWNFHCSCLKWFSERQGEV